MSYGDPMTAAIPTVGASGTQYATDVNAFLTEVRTTLESNVPFSALQGDELDMQNVPITDAQYVGLYDQLVTPAASPVGRLERYAGNLYWVSATGAVQITAAGALNAAGIGGIGGDYGTPNPASFRFENATSLYTAYDDYSTLTWAYLRSRGLDVAAGATSTNVAKIRYGGASSYDFTLPATLPVSNRSVLVVSSAGQVAFNDGTDTITNDIVLGGSTKIQHGDRAIVVPLDTLNHGTGSFTFSGLVINCGIVGNYEIGVKGLQSGYRIKSISCYIEKPDATTSTISIFKYTALTGASANIASQTDATAGVRLVTATAGTPEVVVGNVSYWVQWIPGVAAEKLRSISVVYDIVA